MPAARLASLTRIPLAAAVLCAGVVGQAAAQQTAPPEEPKTESYAIDGLVKIATDRKTGGSSDTFNQPGAELTIDAVHESGLLAHLQLGTVSPDVFPHSNRLNAMLALGWRGGNPEGLHYGAGVAREWFPGAHALAPTGFDAQMNPTGMADTRFDTSYVLGELGWGIVTARYIYVVSRDFRGLNTATVCSGYLPAMLADGDPTKAMNCYGAGFQHTRGTQMLDLTAEYPVANDTKLIGHLGYQRVPHFSGLTVVDYRLGVEHTHWGLVFGASLEGASPRDRELFIGTDANGNTRRMDRTALVLSLGKRF